MATTKVSPIICSLGIAAAVVVHAQPTQPIYLQYDGYVHNKDGSYTISFGYFNMNNVDVTVPSGDANSFAPGPADRNQPLTFVKGRRRFACSMVVDKTFDGHLQWTVRFAGKTSTSTAKALDPLYELELNSEKRAIRGVESSAPRGVCVNRSPNLQVVVSPFEAPAIADVEMQAKVGVELAINAQVEDDGLPRGGTVTTAWKKISGPGEVTFSSTTTGPTRAKFAAPGAYELELSASDGEKTNRLKVTVHVAAS